MVRHFYVYMLRCADGSFYVGQTDDLQRRVGEHQYGGKCVYTSSRRPVRLVWSLAVLTRVEAKRIEATLKTWSRAKKKALIRSDWAAVRAAAKKQRPVRPR